MAKVAAAKGKGQQAEHSEAITIKRPDIRTVAIKLRGTAPLVQHRFSSKIKDSLHAKHAAGHVAKKGSKKDPKDFEGMYEDAKHKSTEGWCGIPAAAFRNAMISACRICGFQMTRAKLSVFVVADGMDANEPTPLVKITKGQPEYFETITRTETGVVNLTARPLWKEWEATVRVRYDAEQFSATDVANLMARAGMQVGVCEGRPDSKKSNGMGWGTFEVVG